MFIILQDVYDISLLLLRGVKGLLQDGLHIFPVGVIECNQLRHILSVRFGNAGELLSYDYGAETVVSNGEP
jgi:hypothetical protein